MMNTSCPWARGERKKDHETPSTDWGQSDGKTPKREMGEERATNRREKERCWVGSRMQASVGEKRG